MAFFHTNAYSKEKLETEEIALPSIDDILKQAEVSVEHPFFYPRVCTFVLRLKSPDHAANLNKKPLEQICAEEFDDFSRRFDRTAIQESCSVRNVLKTRELAIRLIGDDGELKLGVLADCIGFLRQTLYSVMPLRQFDSVRDEHILGVLELLQSNKELIRLLRHMTRPVSNRLAEQIVRDTLVIAPNIPITDVHVRRAALAAWLCTLRQSLGSCFATAPAILVHKEQPHLFLRDLDEMMNTGYMRRTYAGKEYSVPMSATWGNGDLKKPLILEKDLNQNENKIWFSPGLMMAMEAVALFPDGMAINEKFHELRKQLQKSIHLIDQPGHLIVTNAEELIRVLLLSRYELTERKVEDYLARPKSMMQSEMLVHVPSGPKFAQAKEDPILQFLRDLELAKTAFKVLADNALLKSWEFTLASFSEINLDFTRWNLYASLGINYDDPGGIGECLHQILSLKVEHANLELKELQIEYEQILAQMHYLEGRAHTASTEKEINWLKMEYQGRQTELYHIDQVRQQAHEKASKIAALYEFLLQQYDRLFFDFFQEVYDADLHDVAGGPFDDCPAGFRLLYKHGRSNPSLWTRIQSLPDFIESLVSFLTITEADLRSSAQIKGIENEFSLVTTQLIGHVRCDEFIESAFYRMAKAHGSQPIAKPLENLDKIEKKPWVYTSGGSMSTLVSAYFRREEKPTEVARWVENETELLAFFIDTMKQQPVPIQEQYLKNCDKSMLIHSPTHAFLLKPALYKEAWTSEIYTYSWIKHKYVEPALNEAHKLYLDEEMSQDIIQSLLQAVPQDYRPRFKQVFQQMPYRLNPEALRGYIVNTIYSDRGLRGSGGPVLSNDEIDSVLYSHLPYIKRHEIKQFLQETLISVFSYDQKFQERVLPVIDAVVKHQNTHGILSAKRLLELAKAISCLILNQTRSSKDLHRSIVKEFRARKQLLSAPVIIADSNWVKDYFAFVLNPGTENLELWSVDFYGVEGKPISYWKMWLNGSKSTPQWGIFSKPFEYVAKN